MTFPFFLSYFPGGLAPPPPPPRSPLARNVSPGMFAVVALSFRFRVRGGREASSKSSKLVAGPIST